MLLHNFLHYTIRSKYSIQIFRHSLKLRSHIVAMRIINIIVILDMTYFVSENAFYILQTVSTTEKPPIQCSIIIPPSCTLLTMVTMTWVYTPLCTA